MGLILLIYTAPARLLNALALRGYFREAAVKKAPAEAEKTEKSRAAPNREHKSPGPKPLRSALSRIATAYSRLLKKNEIEIERPFRPTKQDA
jgi:hypothetical protein